ncbi:MAG: hypothetical protein NTX64_01430 [Elusimicrobia bacterium]|nr:hypothetical protein [Elusimicrobiota bacterium]
MRLSLLLLAAGLCVGCAHSRNRVEWDDSMDFSHIHRVGAIPFTDPSGKGKQISDAINADLPPLMFEQVDAKALQKILEDHPPSKDNGVGLEALELIRRDTAADAIVLGSMAPGWSAFQLNMVETEMGGVLLRALVLPEDKKQKAFTTPAEVAAAALKVLAGRH